MKIVGYLKKRSNWSVTFDEFGNPEYVAWNKRHEKRELTKVPIFIERLQYKTYYKGQNSISVKFNGDTADSLLSVLKGDGKLTYNCSMQPFMEIFEGLTKGEFDIEEDGWFSGTFTFRKVGSTLSIIPFRGNLEDEDPIDED
jgi:hypothetical protein